MLVQGFVFDYWNTVCCEDILRKCKFTKLLLSSDIFQMYANCLSSGSQRTKFLYSKLDFTVQKPDAKLFLNDCNSVLPKYSSHVDLCVCLIFSFLGLAILCTYNLGWFTSHCTPESVLIKVCVHTLSNRWGRLGRLRVLCTPRWGQTLRMRHHTSAE